MSIPSLLGSYIDETYQRLVQVSGSEFADGLGNPITFGTIDTSSFATTGSNTFKADQIISGSLYVTGDVVAYSPSDERLKDNIQLISNPIEKVQQLRGVEFDWNDLSEKRGQHEYGVIAQDVQKIFPELVNKRYNGYLGVDYDKMIGLLIEVVKVQEERIKNLENKLNQ